MPKRYLVTSALPYANGPLHIGHLAGAYIPADIYVRYLRLKGEDVKFICGSDEHGAAITIRAKKEGVKPQQIVDKYHPINQQGFEKLGISFDMYHRTSDALHHETSSAYFKKLYDDGVFVEKKSEQYYDTDFNQFLADRYITGTCPKCEHPAAYGDQCENCGSDLSPKELINPKSTLSGATPQLKETSHWYLPMQKYEAWVKQWIDESNQNEAWKKHVYGQCQSWLNAGLQERAMTRDLDWGVPVPVDGADGKVLYVWLDAPIGYISATKALTDKWEDYWKDEDTKLVHFIGKDNIVFHCIIFPILLHAFNQNTDKKFVLPTNIPANQFMNLEGDKMSTSRNYAVWLHEYQQDFPDMQDELRYVLTANMPEGKDSDFSWTDFKTRVDTELVDVLGGFVYRTLVLIQKNYGESVNVNTDFDNEILSNAIAKVDTELSKFADNLDRYIHKYELRNALNCLMDLARAGNKFLGETEPWHLVKNDKNAGEAALATCLKIVGALSVYMEPFLPFTSKKLKGFLSLNANDCQAIINGDYNLVLGKSLQKPSHLFKRFDLEAYRKEGKQVFKTMEEAKARKAAELEVNSNNDVSTKASVIAPLKDTITYDDFAKLDMRVGTILAAEKVKKSKKLLKLQVDLGFETRQILSGISPQYTPEEVIGKKVVVLANLASKKMAGEKSNGMILMSDAGEIFSFINPEMEESENGSCIS